MADVGALDFRGFVVRREKQLPDEGREGGRGYAYASDRHTRKVFDAIKPVETACAAAVRLFEAYGKSELLGHAVKVGPKQFPRVHNLAIQCAEELGICTPTVYIVNNPVMNAATFGTNEASVIMIHSGLIDHFSDEELLSVIGHECGHVHNRHVVYLTALHYLRFLAGALVRQVLAPAELALKGWLRRARSRATERACSAARASTSRRARSRSSPSAAPSSTPSSTWKLSSSSTRR